MCGLEKNQFSEEEERWNPEHMGQGQVIKEVGAPLPLTYRGLT